MATTEYRPGLQMNTIIMTVTIVTGTIQTTIVQMITKDEY